MKKFFGTVLVFFIFLFGTGIANARPAQLKRVDNNVFPKGWKYETGYTLWRTQKGLPANRVTYRRYRRDRLWHNNMHNRYRTGEIFLDTLDWTVAESLALWERNADYFLFHPAGSEAE